MSKKGEIRKHNFAFGKNNFELKEKEMEGEVGEGFVENEKVCPDGE